MWGWGDVLVAVSVFVFCVCENVIGTLRVPALAMFEFIPVDLPEGLKMFIFVLIIAHLLGFIS